MMLYSTQSGYKSVINLKKLNQNILHIHFKKEGLSLLKELLQKGDFLCKLDLKDAYFSVALHKISWKYLRFPWQENFYKFLCLCFDMGYAPRIFTKLMKILVPGSIEIIICLIKANDSSDRPSFINNNSCSSSTFALLIFTTSTNSRVSS